jgi:hypothetical protein
MSVKLIGMTMLAYLDVVEGRRSAVRVLVNISCRYWNIVMSEASDNAKQVFGYPENRDQRLRQCEPPK